MFNGFMKLITWWACSCITLASLIPECLCTRPLVLPWMKTVSVVTFSSAVVPPSFTNNVLWLPYIEVNEVYIGGKLNLACKHWRKVSYFWERDWDYSRLTNYYKTTLLLPHAQSVRRDQSTTWSCCQPRTVISSELSLNLYETQTQMEFVSYCRLDGGWRWR